MIKNAFFLVFIPSLLYFSVQANAQEVEMNAETIIETEDTHQNSTESIFDKLGCGIHTVGLYISPYGTIYRNDIADHYSAGGKISLLFNNRFHWGMYANKSTGKLKAIGNDELFFHTKEYGGNIEFTLWNRNWIHLGIPVQLGYQLYRIDSSGGGFFDFDERERNRRDDDDERSNALAKTNAFDEGIIVLEPGINLEINVFHWLKLYSAVNYRLLAGNDILYQNNPGIYSIIQVSKMSSLGFQLGAKVGFFEPKKHCCSMLH